MRRLPLILAALILGGCISERRGSVAEEPVWRIGRTTAREVVAEWGNPDFVFGDTWVWWNSEAIGGKLRAAYMQVGVTVANSRRGIREYRLTFGPDGKLRSVDTSESMPGGPQWSLLPE